MPLIIKSLRAFRDYKGRSSIVEFWSFVFACILFQTPLALVDFFIGWDLVIIEGYPTFLIAETARLALLPPLLALGVRRMHDIGRSGWWAVLLLFHVFGFLALLPWLLREGDPQDNRFGPPPSDA